MSEKTWNKMNGWEKTCEVAKVAAGIALFALTVVAVFSGSGNGEYRSGRSGSSVWTVGHGGKKVGSWSSFRHS